MLELVFGRRADYEIIARELDKEIVKDVVENPDKIEKFMQKLTKFFEMNNEFISKIESADNGLDVYVSSKALCNTLMSSMELHPNKSFTLAGVKNGKRVYKNTYALHY